MDSRSKGVVKWFNSELGFGFITEDGDDAEYFVHYSYIEMEGYKTLKADQPVTFVMVNTDKGVQAQQVRPV
jgi:cold shock protein